jgi:hypothetical protein
MITTGRLVGHAVEADRAPGSPLPRVGRHLGPPYHRPSLGQKNRIFPSGSIEQAGVGIMSVQSPDQREAVRVRDNGPLVTLRGDELGRDLLRAGVWRVTCRPVSEQCQNNIMDAPKCRSCGERNPSLEAIGHGAEVGGRPLKAGGDRNLRLPAQHLSGEGDVGLAPPGIVAVRVRDNGPLVTLRGDELGRDLLRRRCMALAA